MAGTYVISRHNGKVFRAALQFTEEEIDNILYKSFADETYVVINLITREQLTHKGRMSR